VNRLQAHRQPFQTLRAQILPGSFENELIFKYCWYHSVQNPLSFHLLSKDVKTGIYKTILLPVFSYGCKTWTLILREEHSLRVFENRVLRTIFGSKRDEMGDGLRKLHNKGLRNFYSPPSIIRMIKSRGNEMGRACSTYRIEEECI
jgi:hypothetical protein